MAQPSEENEDVNMTENDTPSSRDPIPSLVSAAASKDMSKFQTILQEHAHEINVWMDNLISQLLPSQDGMEVSSHEALLVVGTLAQYDPSKYLPFIAKSFASRVDDVTRIPGSKLVISPDLLRVWIHQMTETSQVAVHSYLLQALLQAMRMEGPPLAEPAINELIRVWRFHWDSPKHPETASIVSVRCAAIFVDCVVALGDVVLSPQGTTLLCAMLQHQQDPLLQLSVLDLFPQHFATNFQPKTIAWLTSSIFVNPILEMLEDPLLAGAALQCASWIATLDDANDDNDTLAAIPRQRVLHYIRNEMGVTTSESDRLASVHALVQLSSITRVLDQVILRDEILRSCWWDMRRLSSPKLQAAILSSISQVLSGLSPSDATIGIRMYTYLAMDNHETGTSTTDWLSRKYSRSPMSELRVATYAVWSAVARLGSAGVTALSTSAEFWNLLLEGPRETTTDARIAKFDLIHTLYESSKGFLAKSFQTKLEKLIELGPHAMPTMTHDVATE